MVLQLKTTQVGDKTYAEVQDGKPVYVETDDNSLVPFDAPASKAAIGRLNNEAKTHREKAEELAGKVKLFEGIEDPVAAKAALETVKNLGSGELLAAGKVEEIKLGAIKATKESYEGQLRGLTEAKTQLERDKESLIANLHGEKISNAFAMSKYIGDKLTLPAPAAQKIFGECFKVEGDKIVAYDSKKNRIYSAQRPGEDPDFDEALGIIVNSYPHKDSFLKGKGQGGGGGGGNNGGGNNGGNDDNKLLRSAFQKMSPIQQRETMAKGIVVVDDPK